MKLLPLLALLLVLTGCSFSTGSDAITKATESVAFHSGTISYDPEVWTFVSDMDSLELKTDEYCWIDTTEDLTQHDASWDYDVSTEDALTVYNLSGVPDYVSFPMGTETVEGSVGFDRTEECMAAYRDLSAVNSK